MIDSSTCPRLQRFETSFGPNEAFFLPPSHRSVKIDLPIDLEQKLNNSRNAPIAPSVITAPAHSDVMAPPDSLYFSKHLLLLPMFVSSAQIFSVFLVAPNLR